MKVKLKNIANIWVGYQPKGRIDHDADGTHRLIQIKDFQESGAIDFGNLSWVVPDRAPERYQVGKGDVLFSARGRYTTAYVLEDVPGNTIAGGNFFVVRPEKNGVLPEYLAWVLNQPLTQEAIKSRTMGSNISYVSKKAFGDLEVPVPPLEIQRKICQLIRLQKQEQRLLVHLAAKREQLVQVVCYRVAHQG